MQNPKSQQKPCRKQKMRSQESLSLQVVPLSFLTSLFALQAMSSLDLTTKQLPPTSTATNQLWFQHQKKHMSRFLFGVPTLRVLVHLVGPFFNFRMFGWKNSFQVQGTVLLFNNAFCFLINLPSCFFTLDWIRSSKKTARLASCWHLLKG